MAKFDSFKQREKKKCLTSKFFRMEYNNQLSENDKRFADEFSNYGNGKMASPRKVGKALADDHRYLVNEKAKLMFYFTILR